MKQKTLSMAIIGLLFTPSLFLFGNDLPSSAQGREAMGFVNPSSRFQVDRGWNLFLNTEFLWWVAKEDGLYYAQSGYSLQTTSAIPPNGAINFDGHLEKVKSSWRPGFRIGFGGNMSYDEWDILLNWTWFQSTARDSSRGTLLVLWGHPDFDDGSSTTTAASQAKAKWELGLNLLDLEMGRSFWAGKHFSLRPFFGIRGTWIDQRFKIDYQYLTNPTTTGKLKMASDFEGGGVRAGLDTRFSLLNGWSFYGLATASMLYGFFNGDSRGNWEGDKIAGTRDGFHQATSTVQMALGVRWDTYLHKDRYHIGLYAGWEQNIWFGLNKMNHYFGQLHQGNLEQLNGDLSLQGGTFGVRFDF